MKSCHEIVKIINQQENATFFERAEMKMHLLMCKHCSAYFEHLKLMKNGFKKLFFKLTKTESEKIEKIQNDAIEQLRKGSKE